MSICEEWVKTRGSFLKLCQSPIAITFPGGVTEVISVCFGGTSRLHFPFTKLLQLHALAEDCRMVVNVVHQVSWKVKMSVHVFPRLPERGVRIFNENLLPKIEVSEVWKQGTH